jgi:predicted RNA-binding Zn-ribbon protein involved in translation (DUF1610 family)
MQCSAGLGLDIAIGNCLLQSLMKDSMEIADGLGCKPLFCQGVVMALTGVRVEGIQFDSSQAGLDSVVDICWYTLARKMSEDVAPEDMGRKKKDTTVYDRNENEGVIMSCPFCGEAFIRRSNRAMTCGKPECTRARKRLNKKNSRQKQKITAQQSK